MPNIRLDLEYDGSGFSGWQVQPGVHTIQSHLESCLLILINSQAKKQGLEPITFIKITASGRTDAGVHAKQQVVHFIWPDNIIFPENVFIRSINGLTEDKLSIKSYQFVPDDFHARFSCTSKEYVYTIFNRDVISPFYRDSAWFIIRPLNLDLFSECIELIKGTHDFKCFRASDCTSRNTIKTIFDADVISKGPVIEIHLIGNGFLKNMVRFIVGAIVEVSSINNARKRDFDYIKKLINGQMEVRDPIYLAPPHGLCLNRVSYEKNSLLVLRN